ncbi:hypothetical protein E3P92_03952 [Wallemia ichthyophaga]|uniref:Major facilitator superfamily (MFS) profile domain-containing protein n=1 Tax=Wallemia ichthyophaga TaxID=245174 RepID=A0A4T0GXF2_WALIC|nr:hypothetical protein E3P93_03944 [Wallemia ichthyophaga]TIB07709.1 hypothetical protein E3P90_03947 [Wallemia ichthyophaga]TIB07798.1 hypothetical protein E3P92_03952 [Wallemia ichthyophaga]TIB19463.1 hypothetical protein E3P89_03934 [Wallemia ichthyophaga]TIB20406.1 hypothetical protein E3P88_03934 [Wallemia ichthyophaga]
MATQAKRFEDLNAEKTEKTQHSSGSSSNEPTKNEGGGGVYFENKTAEGKIILTEDAAPECTALAFSEKKKWAIAGVVAYVQLSMNYNASVYNNALSGMTEHFGISTPAGKTGQMIFLVAYAFGCELWAPWSEEFGRFPILQLSLFLVNIWCILCARAPNIGAMIVGRGLGGLSSAGGSVTLGMVADLWGPDTQQYGLGFIVWSSVAGSTAGPILGGFVEQFAGPGPAWRWVFYTQLIWGVSAQLLHFCIPETRSTIMLDREAKRRRKAAAKEGIELNIWGPNEVREQRLSMKEILVIWYRPFEMFIREPIVLSCSLLSGFSDMLIFIFLDSFGKVFAQWDFQTYQVGLAFVSILISYFLGWVSFLPFFRRQELKRKRGVFVPPEERLYWLLWTAPLEAIGLFGFSWTSFGPDRDVHWIAPLIFAALIGIANYAIYMATIDYMVAAYGPYASSATGGNGFARDFLAGISAMFASPFYNHFDNNTLEIPSTILACIATVLIIPIFLLYFYGESVRKHSKFAQTLASERETTDLRHQSIDDQNFDLRFTCYNILVYINFDDSLIACEMRHIASPQRHRKMISLVDQLPSSMISEETSKANKRPKIVRAGFQRPSYVSELELKLRNSEGLNEDYKNLLEKFVPQEVTESAKRKWSGSSPSFQKHSEAADIHDGFYVDESMENCRHNGITTQNQPEKQKRFFGKASIRGLIERLSNYTGFSPTALLSGKRPRFWQEEILIDGLDHLPPDLLSPSLVESLVDLYFEKINRSIPLLSKKRFVAGIAYRRNERNFEALFMLVLALGAQYSNDERVLIEGQHQFLAGLRYHSIGKSKMIDPYIDVATIEDIQALILLQIYVQKGIHSRSGWMIHGNTVLLAHDIGLHLRFVDFNIAPHDLELRKRAYWSLYLMDRVQASTFGRQTLIKDNEISLDLPKYQLGDDESEYSVLYFNSLIDLYKIHGQIIQTIYKLRKTSDGDDLLMSLTDIASLNSKLNKWLNEIPQSLADSKSNKSMDDKNGNDEYVYQLYCNLKLAFHVVQICLYKTFLPDPLSQSTSSFRYTSLVICTTSARSIISIYRDMLLEDKLQHLWVDPTVAWGPFSAALILIISACEGLKNNDLDTSVFSYIQSAIQVLRLREEREVLNGRAVDMIMQIVKAVNLPMDQSFMQTQDNLSYGTLTDSFLPHMPFLDDSSETTPNQTESTEQLFKELLGQVQYNTINAATLGVNGTPPLDGLLPLDIQDGPNVLETFLSGSGGL